MNKSVTPAYKSWVNMRLRCKSPKNKQYKDYGGRGITVCEEWVSNYDTFLRDMGQPPVGFTIERIDNDRGYSKDNCKWASRLEQNNNRRIRSTNKHGISGVFWYCKLDAYLVYYDQPGNRIHLGYTKDFFEACCRRKAAENFYKGNL